jgi:methylthioribose-1-phosphate isomerase
MLPTIYWKDGRVLMLDQRKLPWSEKYLTCRTVKDVIEAIRNMVIRGAPAIGIAAAMGVALGASRRGIGTHRAFFRHLDQVCEALKQARPTAVNLAWAVNRMKALADANRNRPVDEIRELLMKESQTVLEEDVAINRAIGTQGAHLVPDGATVLTHCNAGALATGGYGTALGVIRAAVESGKNIRVLADETRPFLQGARLTAWELQKDEIPVTVIGDTMAASLMRSGDVQVIVVGADRIAANGDTANKIGTYPLAVLADAHNVPFYVAAPLSTIDLSLKSGDEIPIEERPAYEVASVFGKTIVPDNVPVRNIAFDVTPHEIVTGIITQKGVASEPYETAFRRMFEEK